MNDRNITNARFIQVIQIPQIDSYLAAKMYFDNSIDEPLLLRNIQDNDFNHFNLTNIKSITLITQAVNGNQVITKTYLDQFHQQNEQSRRVLGIDFYNESCDLVKNNQDYNFNDKKLTNTDSITVVRNPTADNEVTNKNFVYDSIEDQTIVRFNQTLQSYLKVPVGNERYNLTRYDRIQLTDITSIKYPNSGGFLLPGCRIFCNDKNYNGKIQNFIKSTRTNSPTGDSGATSLPPTGDSFIYIETSSNNFGNKVFVSWERIDTVQNTNITFYYNRFSILTNNSIKSMGRFRI